MNDAVTSGEMSERDSELLHYATGLLMGLHEKYGDRNVVIYHQSLRIRIERVGRRMIAADLGKACR